jgi:hypothetical protein
MTAHSGRRLRLALAGFAAGGLMLGHWAAYVLRAPDAHERTRLLAATGHTSLPKLTAVAAAAVLLGLLLLPYGASPVGRGRWRPMAGRLIALQCGGFASLEVAERLAVHAGDGLAHALLDPTIAAGLALQVPIGAVAALLLAALLGLVPVRPPLAGRSPPPRVRHRPPPPRSLPALRPGRDALTLRGPPVHSPV